MRYIFIALIFGCLAAGCDSKPKVRFREKPEEVVMAIQTGDALAEKPVWDISSYEKGAAVFSTIERSDKNSLQSYSHDKGKILFDRLTAYPEFDQLMKGKTPDEQMKISVRLSIAMRALIITFNKTDRTAGKLQYGHEMIRCFMANMVLAQKNFELADLKFPDKEAMDEVRKGGLKKMQNGLTAMITGSFIILNKDYSYYEASDIAALKSFLDQFVPSVRQYLTKEQQDMIDAQYEQR